MKNSRLTVFFVFVFMMVGELWLPLAMRGGALTKSFVDERGYHIYHSRYNQAELTVIFQKDAQFTFDVRNMIQNSGNTVRNNQSSSSGPLDSPWPMMSHDVCHTGRSSYNTTQPPEGVEIWRFFIQGGYADGGVVIDKEGTLYFGCMDGHMYAMYPNETRKWTTILGYGAVDSTPAIDENGILYIGTIWSTGTPNRLYAIYTNNGTEKWSYPTGSFGDIDSSPAIGTDGTIYFGAADSWFYALNPDGSTKWKYHTGGAITGSPAIGSDGTVYIGSQNSVLYAFNPENGTVKWSFPAGGWVRVSPCVGDDGTVYCVSFDNYLYAIYPDNGTMKWRTFVNAGTNPTIGPDGTIYAGWNILYAVNPDGSVKWNYTVNGYIEGGTPCTSREGVIYLGTSYGSEFIALNPDGTLRWKCHIGVCQSPPAIDSNGFIYIGTEYDALPFPAGFLHAFGQGPLRAEAYGPYEGLVNTSVQFTGDGFGGALPYTFLWDFGDHHTSNEQNPKHTYTGPGVFNVTLTIHDGYGNSTTDNATTTITYPGPSVHITRPKGGIYFLNIRVIPFPFIRPTIFGPITIEATATQTPLGISHVDFYADEKFLGTDAMAPYSCVWRGALSPRSAVHGIYARAYDNGGKSTRAQIIVYKFF
jgi:outer membrane protein assembly factor BamB